VSAGQDCHHRPVASTGHPPRDWHSACQVFGVYPISGANGLFGFQCARLFYLPVDGVHGTGRRTMPGLSDRSGRPSNTARVEIYGVQANGLSRFFTEKIAMNSILPQAFFVTHWSILPKMDWENSVLRSRDINKTRNGSSISRYHMRSCNASAVNFRVLYHPSVSTYQKTSPLS
jgi:hypothetical protein